MKKKLAFLLAIVMVLAIVFVGCDSGKAKKDDDDDDNKTTVSTTVDSNATTQPTTKPTTKPTTTTTTAAPNTLQDELVGTWAATGDYSDVMYEIADAYGLLAGMEDYMHFEGIDQTFVF